jgi:V8-like Glu-specific endopeptidase
MRQNHRAAAALVLAAALGVGTATVATGQEIQPAPLITELMPVEIDSGPVSNTGEAEAVIFSERVFIPGAAALRLEFDEVALSGLLSDGSGSYLRIRSLWDGAEQRLNARHVEQWRNTSAYFNGDEVVIEIVAQPGTGVNRLRMSGVQAQFEPFNEESICGSTDDRLPSEDNRAARLLPIGCTGWVIDDCNHCLITAGHCSTSDGSITNVQFNVPLSNSNGSLNHPPPEDQYAVDLDSRQSNGGGGVGNDYAYFGVFPNSNTGLTPAEAYGVYFELTMPPPVQGQDIRITGYGTTGNGVPREWNQAQKTHTGPYFSFIGTTLDYQTDTTGGNSGSPVIDESTGLAIGVHTHGGCSSNSGNHGTGLNHPGFQNFLNNPRGVCECPLVDFFFPNGLPELIDPSGGTQILLEVLPDGDSEPEPGSGRFFLDTGSGFVSVPMDEIQDNVYIATFPAVECGETVRYYFSAQTTSGEEAFEPRGAPGRSFSADAALGIDSIFADNFETDKGWTVVNEDLATGAWERAVPVNAGRGDPPSDYDGSGKCYVTDNRRNEDVDGGPTRLISPALRLADAPEAVVSYARWFYNDDRDQDRLDVEVSNDDGNTWRLVESVPHVDGWVETKFRVADFVTPTDAVRVRFSATDNPNNSITEAAVDAFHVFTFVCSDCDADFNGDGVVDTLDVLDFLNAWADGDDSADFNGDGEVDTQDFLAFLNAWAAGC